MYLSCIVAVQLFLQLHDNNVELMLLCLQKNWADVLRNSLLGYVRILDN